MNRRVVGVYEDEYCIAMQRASRPYKARRIIGGKKWMGWMGQMDGSVSGRRVYAAYGVTAEAAPEEPAKHRHQRLLL